MSPRTPLISLAAATALLAACGAPPEPQHTSPPYAPPSASAAPLSLPPVVTPPLPTLTGTPTATYPTYTPLPTLTRTVTPTPTTRSPTPTPSHAPRCTAEPTAAQILTLVEADPGAPEMEMRVVEGPFCSGTWSFTTLEVADRNDKQEEPLLVVATGRGTALEPVAIGSDVCVDRVQTGAPPGIRVLACGF